MPRSSFFIFCVRKIPLELQIQVWTDVGPRMLWQQSGDLNERYWGQTGQSVGIFPDQGDKAMRKS